VTEIPDAIRHNVADLALNDVLHVRDLKLPPGVRALLDGEVIIATVKAIAEEETAPAPEASAAEPEVIGRKAEEGAETAEEK
jgi:large subunit ribosomal protein L25